MDIFLSQLQSENSDESMKNEMIEQNTFVKDIVASFNKLQEEQDDWAMNLWAFVAVLRESVLILRAVGATCTGSSVAGLGEGTAITTALIALIANAGTQNQAVATAVSYLFRSLGSVICLCLVSTAAQETLRSKLYSRLSGDDAVEQVCAINLVASPILQPSFQIIEGARKSLNYIPKLPPKVKEKVVLS
ncbi:hypothetical protein K474DRAFT_1710791 [Panus rudis PR-1116 ss-1]|nr:hypothetical protein K474DRAFT_1710791 [Panus rudis PR-1116 ss-1]